MRTGLIHWVAPCWAGPAALCSALRAREMEGGLRPSWAAYCFLFFLSCFFFSFLFSFINHIFYFNCPNILK